MVLASLQDGGTSGSLRGFGDVVEVSQALRANMVAEGRATNACYLDALRLLTPLQQVQVSSPVRRLATARTRCSEFDFAHLGLKSSVFQVGPYCGSDAVGQWPALNASDPAL